MGPTGDTGAQGGPGASGSTPGAPGNQGAQGAVGPVGPTGPAASCYGHGGNYSESCYFMCNFGGNYSIYFYNYDAFWDGCYDIQCYTGTDCTGWYLGGTTFKRFGSSCCGQTNGSGYYTYYYFCSDRRLKTNISTLENSLNNILEIDTVEFDWNEKLTDGKYYDINGLKKVHSIGLIAQNVKEFYPTVVKVSQTGYYYIEYVKLNAVLVEGIKEQQVFIDDIENQIKELESKFI